MKPFDVRVVYFFQRWMDRYLHFRRGATPDDRWLANFKKGNESFEIEYKELRLKLYKDSVLCKFIFDSFEEAEVLFTRRFLKSGDRFIDAGANIGLFALNASVCVGETGHVYAFEPTPVTFNRLKENVALNQLHNLTLESLGLSDKNELLNLHMSLSGYDAWNSFAPVSPVGETINAEVPVVAIDTYIENKGIKEVILMKIDVEGWEMYVLKGASKLLSSIHSPVLMVEFTEDNAFAAGFYCGEIFEFVRSFGYEWYRYNASSNTLELQKKKLHYPYENLIAIKDLKKVMIRLKEDVDL